MSLRLLAFDNVKKNLFGANVQFIKGKNISNVYGLKETPMIYNL